MLFVLFVLFDEDNEDEDEDEDGGSRSGIHKGEKQHTCNKWIAEWLHVVTFHHVYQVDQSLMIVKAFDAVDSINDEGCRDRYC